MYILYLCRIFYSLITFAALICEIFPKLRERFVYYGKVADSLELKNKEPSNELLSSVKTNKSSKPKIVKKTNEKKGVIEKLLGLTVPKSYFSYFYLVGIIVSSQLLMFMMAYEKGGLEYFNSKEKLPIVIVLYKKLECEYLPLVLNAFVPKTLGKLPSEACAQLADRISKELVLILGLYNIHVIIRACETVFFQPTSEARMHLGHFIVGLAFYVVTPISLVIEGVYAENNISSTNQVIFILGLVLYTYSVIMRTKSHTILFKLRTPKDTTESTVSKSKGPERVYNIPVGGMFEKVSSPHYLGEILMYLSFWMLSGLTNITVGFVLMWVSVNLSISAIETHRWYKRKFGSAYPSNRYAIFPGIL